MNEPIPVSDAQRDAQCAELRRGIARMQSVQQIASGPAAMAIIARARDNIAAAESRRAQIQCDVVRVAPTAPIIPN